MNSSTTLKVENLRVHFKTKMGIAVASNNINFEVKAGERLGIVGESGSGKSVTAKAILRLLPSPPATITGKINFKGENLLDKTEKEMCGIRGDEISMIFQEPMTSLNPVFTIGNQLIETIVKHQKLNKKEAKEKAVEMLRLVGIPSPESRLRQYPFEFSGGMRQRVMIAIALSCNPKILIADEPTTALDVTIQAQILELMKELNEKFNTSIIMITHDMGVIAETVDNVIVMYAGNIIEYSDVYSVLKNPLHPYTQGLLDSIPRLDIEKNELDPIKGIVPSLYDLPVGCKFSTRCKYGRPICEEKEPPLQEIDGKKVSCWMYSEEWDQ
jgi:peptide/nickel transport system ATP-binding protein/oligopeptide transport system ATP-binding protein